MSSLLDINIWQLILTWIGVFAIAMYVLPKIKISLFNDVTPLMIVMPVSFILSDQIISNYFYVSYLIYFLLLWLVIGLIFFIVSVRVIRRTTIRQFWMDYLRASSLVGLVLLVFSLIIWTYRIFSGS